MATTTVETAQDRRTLVQEAGMPKVSFLSILAGTLVAFGAIALLAAAAGAVGSQIGLTTDGISTDEWRQAGIGATVAGALALLVSFFFGGYTAGRMGRRAGLLHGLGVFVLAALLLGVIAALAAWLGDPDAVQETLNDNGVPTSANTWSDIGIGAAIAGVVAMLAGAVLGGMQGDRWHTSLTRTAIDRRRERVLGIDGGGERVRDRDHDEDRDRDEHRRDDDHGERAERDHDVRRDGDEQRTSDEHHDLDDDHSRSDRTLGQDPTTIDLRDDDPARREPSVEEEREQARQGRSDVGR